MYRDEIIPLADVLTPNDFEARYVCESCRLANHGVFCIIVFFYGAKWIYMQSVELLLPYISELIM